MPVGNDILVHFQGLTVVLSSSFMAEMEDLSKFCMRTPRVCIYSRCHIYIVSTQYANNEIPNRDRCSRASRRRRRRRIRQVPCTSTAHRTRTHCIEPSRRRISTVRRSERNAPPRSHGGGDDAGVRRHGNWNKGRQLGERRLDGRWRLFQKSAPG